MDDCKPILEQLKNKSGGRPKHSYWKTGNFTLSKNPVKKKVQANCNICSKVLLNTSVDRLKQHRNKCIDKSPPQGDDFGPIDSKSNALTSKHKQKRMSVVNQAELGERFTEIRQNGRKVAVRCDNCELIIKNTTYSRLEAHWLRCYKYEPIQDQDQDEEQLLEEMDFEEEPARVTTNIKIERMPIFVKCDQDEVVEQVLPTPLMPQTSQPADLDQEKVVMALADLLYANPHLPWSIVETDTFRIFVGQLNSSALLPTAKQVATTLLEQTHVRCMTKLRPSESHSVLLLHKFTPPGSLAKLAGFLRNHEKQQIFLKHFDFPAHVGPTDDIENGNSSTLNDFYLNCLQFLCKLAHDKFQTEVFCVVWNNLLGIEENLDATRWHFTSSGFLANQLAREFFNTEMRNNVLDIFGEFKQPELEEKLVESGGTAVQMLEAAATNSLVYLNLCRVLLADLDRLKLIATNKYNEVTPRITKLLFDNYFIAHIADLLSNMSSIEALLTATQNPTTCLGDVAQHWLTLEVPSSNSNVNWTKFQRIALNNYTLVANYLHPKYLGVNLHSEHLDVIDEFFLLMLSEAGLSSLENLRSKRGIFDMLITKNIQSPITFWNFAERKNAELARTALKLFKIPVTAGEIISRLQFPSNAEQLSIDGYEKRLFLYFHLSLGGA